MIRLRRSCFSAISRRPLVVAAVAVVLIAAAAAPARAQRRTAVLVGWIRDSSGTPVEGANVEIPAMQALARTDSTGRFRLAPLDPGLAHVTVRRIGYSPQTFDVTLHASIIDSVAVRMPVNVQLLDAMRTDATLARQYAALEGFYRRRAKGGGGFFYTRDDIEQRHTNVLSDVVREVPGVRVVGSRGMRAGLRFDIANGKPFNCPPQYWLDGRRTTGVELDDFPATDVEGLELYPGPASTPLQFSQGSALTCGTVVIWTRIPGT